MAEDILKLLQNKLVFLQREKIIRVDAATRFQLEQEIKEVQAQIQEITREIEKLQTKPAIASTETPATVERSLPTYSVLIITSVNLVLFM